MNKYKITINGNLYEVEINSLTDTHADVCVNGKPYGVGIEKEGIRSVSGKAPVPKQTVMQAEQPRPVEETISAGELAIKSPLPGTILSGRWPKRKEGREASRAGGDENGKRHSRRKGWHRS